MDLDCGTHHIDKVTRWTTNSRGSIYFRGKRFFLFLSIQTSHTTSYLLFDRYCRLLPMCKVYVYSLMYDILYNRAIKDVCLRPIICWVCGFEPHRDLDICLLVVLCVDNQWSLLLAYHSSIGIQRNEMSRGLMVKTG
jgi:hypothetical protein